MRRIWEFEDIRKEALKYTRRVDFARNSQSAYNKANKKGWLEELCNHMKEKGKSWTYEAINEEALKYNNAKDFRKNSLVAYVIARKKGWYEQVTNHMYKGKSIKERLIYAYEFSENYVYVGLTCNLNKRAFGHTHDSSPVHKHLESSGSSYTLVQKTNFIDVDSAIKLESSILEEYKNNGWNVLNRAKTGAIGYGKEKWDFKTVEKEALKYKTKASFLKECSGAYWKAAKEKWLPKICGHMVNPHRKWYPDNILEEALKYKTRTEFHDKSSGAFTNAKKYGILCEVCSHMIPKFYWDTDSVANEAKKYPNKKSLQRNSPGAYSFAYRNNMLEKLFFKSN